MLTWEYRLTGLSPLILHNDNLEGAAQVADWCRKHRKESKAGDDRTPPWTWKTCLYHDGEQLFIPTEFMMACLWRAAVKVILKGNTSYKAAVAESVHLEGMGVPLLVNGKTIPIKEIEAIGGTFAEHCAAVRKLGFRLFAKRAKVGQSKHVRVRPVFDNWSLRGRLSVEGSIITLDVLREIFDVLGRRGLGDWRPSAGSPGPYGRASAEVTRV